MEEKILSEADVTFGVPEGTVIGLFLFLFFINDLRVGVQSDVRLFGDDSSNYNKTLMIFTRGCLHGLVFNQSRYWLDVHYYSFSIVI